MKISTLVFATLVLLSVASASERGDTPNPVSAPGPNRIFVVPGSIQKVCQVTGETDLEFNTPTASQTETRFGLVRADHGYSFEHNGKLFFLFGDTHPTPTFNNHPNTQSDYPRTPDDNDAIGFVSDTSAGPCLKLDFITDSIGAYKNPVVLDAQGHPSIKLRTNESPISGISDGGRMYVIFGTDNPIDTVGPPAPLGYPARTVMAVSDDDANTFHFLYNFSREPQAKFINTAIARGQDGFFYFWGTQGDTLYRKSAPFLARKPIGSMADSTAIQYLHALNPDGTPVFMAGESNAAPLFHDSLPGPGGAMQVADGMGELGVEWNPFVHRWVMLYNCLNNTPANRRGIYMRLAEKPWGPWSAPQTIFNPIRDNGYCFFMHRAVTPTQPACDSLSGPDRIAQDGGEYGPYFISRFTTGDGAKATSTFYFTLDTWNPYTQVIMKASIQGPVTDIPTPSGIYVVNDASNLRATSTAYATGLTSSPAYLNDVTGHAIFVPIAKILPSITTWGQFNWNWSYLDTLVQIAVSHGKKFSIELETGYHTSSTYLQSLPAGFLAAVGANSAPLFDVWTTGGGAGRGISAYIPLPWVPRIQEFWAAAAHALSSHLQQTGTYGSLMLVHVPGLSVYDEEIRLPTGFPRPTTADTVRCPDGRPAYPAVIDDATNARWQSLGYSDSAVVSGFKEIVAAFADAFPDRVLDLSLFPPGQKGIDFPNLTADSVGYVASQIVKEASAIAPGRVQIQADNLDGNYAESEVMSFASRFSDFVGWQSNKHGGAGAGCDGGITGSCNPDGPAGPYFRLLKNAWQTGGEYLEVWSADVVNYPQSFAAAKSAGFFTLTGVDMAASAAPYRYQLQQNYPNPFNPSTTIGFGVSGPGSSPVRLIVFDLLGREVAVLVNEKKEPGSYTVTWNARGMASGVYFYRLQAGEFVQTYKLVLLR